MKPKMMKLSIPRDSNSLLCAIISLSLCGTAVAHKQDPRFEELANSKTFEGRQTEESTVALMDEMLFQRASQIYLWAMPLINTMGMKTGSEKKFGAGYNVLPVWKERLNAKTQILTPNSDVLYALSYVDLGKDGPLVIEAAPKLQAILLDFWQRPIPGPEIRGHIYMGDIGFFGPDKGKGGKFLLLPPDYNGVVPEGYFTYRAETNNVFIFLRSFYQDPKDLSSAVKTMTSTRIYPLGKEDKAKRMIFPNASVVPANMLPASDSTAFDHLKQLLDSEPTSLVESDWRGMLSAIGIAKGKPFKPDARTRKILDSAAGTAYQMSRILGRKMVINGLDGRIFPDLHWVNPMATGNPFNVTWHRPSDGALALDSRTNFFTSYYSWSPGMVSQVPGMGANYWISHYDSKGGPLSGGKNYKITLDPKVPVANFWSMTLYEASNSSGLDNGQPFPSLGSRDKPEVNADGTIDLYFGAKAPAGKEANWMATVPGRGFFAIMRFYSPTEKTFDGSWKLTDFVEVK